MKKFLSTLLFTLTTLTTLFAAEKLNVGLIEDPFFTRTDSIVTIRSLIPHDTQIIAVVDASTDYDSRTLTIAPLYTKSWVHSDCGLMSQENILATVVCGSKIVDKNILKPLEFPYTFVKEGEFQTGELTPGKTVKVVRTKEYTRPDGTIFRKLEDDLYSLTMKREVLSVGQVSVCGREWNIISQWKQKLRHCRTIYDAFDVYDITTKQALSNGYILTGSDPEQISKVFIQRQVKINHVDQESPECGTLGRGLPGGIVII